MKRLMTINPVNLELIPSVAICLTTRLSMLDLSH